MYFVTYVSLRVLKNVSIDNILPVFASFFILLYSMEAQNKPQVSVRVLNEFL